MEIKALFVNPNTTSCTELIKSAAPEVVMSEQKFIKTLRMAIQTIEQKDFNVIFISESFPADDLNAFLKDLKLLDKQQLAIVQTRQALTDDFDPKPILDLGFNAVVSYKGTHRDKEQLLALEAIIKEKQQFFERVVDVRSAVRLLLNELENSIKNKVRGRDYKYNGIATQHINRETVDMEALLEEYHSALANQSDDRKESVIRKLDLPDKVVQKFPGAEKDSYTGVSIRVWDKLAKKFGVKE